MQGAAASVELLRKVPGPFFNQNANDGTAMLRRFIEEANKTDLVQDDWCRTHRSNYTTLISKIKSRAVVCKYMLLDTELLQPNQPLPPFATPSDIIYSGHPILESSRSPDGFALGLVSDPLQYDRSTGCTAGDGYVVGPNGARCGLTWEVLDDGSQPGFATLEKPNPARWGVYHFFVTKPLASMIDLSQMWTGMLPVFRMLFKRAYPSIVLPALPTPIPPSATAPPQMPPVNNQPPQPPPPLPEPVLPSQPTTAVPPSLSSHPEPPPPLPMPTLPSIPTPPAAAASAPTPAAPSSLSSLIPSPTSDMTLAQSPDLSPPSQPASTYDPNTTTTDAESDSPILSTDAFFNPSPLPGPESS